MRLLLCLAAIVVAVAIAGCGGGSSSSSTNDQSTSAQSTTRTTARRDPAVLYYHNTIPRPRNPGPHPGARVERLIVRDVRRGIGPPIQSGDRGIFEFIATNWVTGRSIESAWHKRRPFETEIQHGVVIDGWWQGIQGMRVGGRRQILIPPSLGFTTNPTLTGATTYFDVVLNQINAQRPAGLSTTPAESPAGIGG